jgi:hypothetical protein
MEKIPITDVDDDLIKNNSKQLRAVLEDRLLTYWINKELFQEDTLIISGITGIGPKEEGGSPQLVINYHVLCHEEDGVHRFLYYTTEHSLHRSILAWIDKQPDDYDPKEDDMQNEFTNGNIGEGEGRNFSRHELNGPVFYDEVEFQPIEVIEDWFLNYRVGTAVEALFKYNYLEDISYLEQAIWILLRERESAIPGNSTPAFSQSEGIGSEDCS